MGWIKRYLHILQCPFCRGDLELIEENGNKKLICRRCKKTFKIVDNIPILLKDENE
ncbi:Trm112 family protein [Methanothermococcus okinawensis]|uniref:Trm112 family protein n=1 Tax=Methanothermococcus okinawensis (strain DSM 14208 / JCM 11175 / IH1) TaxID=647113 RepID=F8AK81_METOI|nr:Trm112 family protein [Methanothermococcus okinawensis]AEH07452.1 protein of unknown function DUF343 [Methanothermococcus okinawensis IH1]